MDTSRRGSGIRIEYAKQKMGAVSVFYGVFYYGISVCVYSLVDQHACQRRRRQFHIYMGPYIYPVKALIPT